MPMIKHRALASSIDQGALAMPSDGLARLLGEQHSVAPSVTTAAQLGPTCQHDKHPSLLDSLLQKDLRQVASNSNRSNCNNLPMNSISEVGPLFDAPLSNQGVTKGRRIYRHLKMTSVLLQMCPDMHQKALCVLGTRDLSI